MFRYVSNFPFFSFNKKDIFDEIGMFDETLKVCEDYDLWLRFASKYPVHFSGPAFD